MSLRVFIEGYHSIRDRRKINLFDYQIEVDSLDRVTSIRENSPLCYVLSKSTNDFREFRDVEISPSDEKTITLHLSLQFEMFPRFGDVSPRSIITLDGNIYIEPSFLMHEWDQSEWYLDSLLKELKNKNLGEVRC
ncbi:MAG TPA: hypothetical protein QGI39_14025 [Gammaproteobacteria bacterium]|jgi:hypothetical protein|nr:hypothetical protein [Dehalococcoidia bacterium]HJO13142.1 hypothetical protein [Gammaproteobacteria bacterium]|tara:strand:+ start:477 stop:881 length:405 start_codon:yes stop_codon:yes gene_type:complete